MREMFCLIYEKTRLVGRGPLSYFGNRAQTSASGNFHHSQKAFGEAEIIFHPSDRVIRPIWVRVYCTSLSIFLIYLFLWCVMSVWLPSSTPSQTVGSLLGIQMALSVPFPPLKPSQPCGPSRLPPAVRSSVRPPVPPFQSSPPHN